MEELVIIDTGADPSGVNPGVGGKRKKAREIKFTKRNNLCLMERLLVHSLGIPPAVIPKTR